jgi:photosystem II stability/assembly factor-like uncharacterized protein
MSLFKKLSIIVLCLAFFQNVNAEWKKQNSKTLAWLHSIHFADRNNGWIVGSNGTILKTTDGGENWQAQKKFNEDNIRDVYFSDVKNGWLLCEKNIYGAGGTSPSYLLKTSDGGVNWERINVFADERERIVRLFFSKSGGGFAVGEAGALWAMTDEKSVWKKVSLPVRYLMLAGNFMDEMRGAVVGGGGTILMTEDQGLSWNPATITSNDKKNNAKLNSVFFINNQVGWAVGGQGKILFTNNRGKLWREQNSNVPINLSDVFFISTAEGWAVGDEGTILYTATGGNVWSAEQTKGNYKLEKVFFTGDRGFAVGFGGTILSYTKKGKIEPSRDKPQLQKRTSN